MKKLVFATHNMNKVGEVIRFLPPDFDISSLNDIGCHEDIPETQNTIEGNAIQKAEYVYNKYGLDCFADDTGLVVESLNGQPGVLSARYAGSEKNPEANIQKLLHELEGQDNRSAHFKTVIALNMEGKIHKFTGICQGAITLKRQGTEGFGYDPVFIPTGYSKSFAEMTLMEKNDIGHRGKAVKKLIEYLTSNF